MRMKRATTVATLALLCAGVAAGTSGAAGDPPSKRVKVADNFFSPRRMTVPPNTTIVWKWSRLNGDTHDVLLRKRPAGVRAFHSAPAATGFTFKRKLRKVGTYRMICTFHEDMAMRVVVKR
jgi:plastocyanin